MTSFRETDCLSLHHELSPSPENGSFASAHLRARSHRIYGSKELGSSLIESFIDLSLSDFCNENFLYYHIYIILFQFHPGIFDPLITKRCQGISASLHFHILQALNNFRKSRAIFNFIGDASVLHFCSCPHRFIKIRNKHRDSKCFPVLAMNRYN